MEQNISLLFNRLFDHLKNLAENKLIFLDSDVIALPWIIFIRCIVSRVSKNMDDPSKKTRPIRPGFAEDVYGVGRHSTESSGNTEQNSSTEICGSALAQRRSANLPKLKELCTSGSAELNISSMECPLASARASQMGELEFQYTDSDTYRAELAELYTYSEMDEFALNYDCFVKYMRDRKEEPIWNDLPQRERCKIIHDLVGNFDNVDAEQRLEASRVILYILQGAYGDFAELESKCTAAGMDVKEEENADEDNNGSGGLDIPEKWFGPDHGTGGYEPDCLANAAFNAYLLYEQGLFQPLCSLLRMESAMPFERYADHSRQSSVSNSRSTSHMDLASGAPSEGGGGGSTSGTFERRRSKRSATLADNERLRVVLNCIYHIVEAIRREELIPKILTVSKGRYNSDRLQSLRRQFISELEEPLEQSKAPLLIHLFDMMPSFVRAKNPHFPIKKILLLCWKVLLATLGGIEFLRREKQRKRQELGLPKMEDTLQAAIQMKPILNCGLSSVLFGIGGGGGGQGGDNESGSQLGRKVRSIHTVRPFNRQVACSSNPGQDTPTGTQRERSNAFSEDENQEQEDNQQMADSRVLDSLDKDFEDVNDAIMPAGEEEAEEVEPSQDENDSSSSALLDQMLEELSSQVAAEDEEEEGGGGRESEEKNAAHEISNKFPLEMESTNVAAMANPKITVSGGDNSGSGAEATELKKRAESVEKLDTRRKSDESEDRAVNDLRRKLIAIQIDRKPNVQADSKNGDGGGDQTPKASQSPVKKSSPWPPPPPSGLPWKPKVRESDIENFLQNERQKYFDFQLPKDLTTVFGLPEPVHGSLDALRRNIYTPLNEIQLKADDRYNRFPFSQKEFIEDTPTERFYARMLPCMTEYVIALLKVILASLPSSKAKIDAVTILSDVLTPETDTNEMLSNSISLDLSHLGQNVLEEHVRVAIDINRHKELIIKAASSIIILLLKHFRLNHVYQFENFAQYLVLANCLPLVLKFLDQNICRYFQSKYELAPFNYPQSALHIVRNGNEWPQLTADNVDEGSESPTYFLWRNVFSSINLLRVINKLTKGKQARTLMLVVYKSAPVLKRCMRAKLGIFQLYVLKLLKLQARYLGRQWRKTNMDLISAIYMRVRHRLNDDWAYANETTRTKSFDFQREENELGLAVKKFNARRYPHLTKDSAGNDPDETHGRPSEFVVEDMLGGEWDQKEWEPMDNSLQSALAYEPQFSERFMHNYEQWLEEEVFNGQTDWDALLLRSRGLLDIYC